MNKNNDNKRSGFLAGIVVGIIFAVVVGGCLIMTKVVKLESEEETVVSDDNSEVVEQKDVNITEVTFNGEKIMVSNITHEIISIPNGSKNYDYYAELKESGKVYIRAVGILDNASSSHEGYLTNVSDAVDIIEFSVPAAPDDQVIYMLQSNGDVYYYIIGDSATSKYTATKVDNVSNIVKLFIYRYPLNGALGGTWAIVGIKDNGETVEIRKEGV